MNDNAFGSFFSLYPVACNTCNVIQKVYQIAAGTKRTSPYVPYAYSYCHMLQPFSGDDKKGVHVIRQGGGEEFHQ